ncbi:MAG: VWA domain-containing protein [Phycisphaerales bacterium]|nr:VWA domain-containing protein [Phycisphaerae bacterium]NNF44265.1 VWA domain-containing protein [Phycisphaerales bacterium]NNM27825.1 VWA domain-containing protein [Phycisphaerales bacterium]
MRHSFLPVLSLLFAAAVMASSDATPSDQPTLLDSPAVELKTLDALTVARDWPRRAVAATRLARYRCPESRTRLERLLADSSWRVRIFALMTFATRGETPPAAWREAEQHPRVVRAALRLGHEFDPERLRRGVETLARTPTRDEQLLAIEIAAASGDPTLLPVARDGLKKIILRLDRAEAGLLSPRLAVLTGVSGLHRPHDWKQWLMKTGRRLELRSGVIVAPPVGRIATLDPERFAALEVYMEELGRRIVDLALVIDCTASMGGELIAAQSGMDDLVLFVGDVVGALRIGVVAYRDRRNEFETKGWDFTPDRSLLRERLWSLTAEGGGDTPEAVHPALELAFSKLSWDPAHTMVMILIGDAPPHVGTGTRCIALTRTGAEAGLTTHAIQAEGEPVDHFAEIAAAGGGRCVNLENDDRLIPEIAGLALGEVFEEEFREFFRWYLGTCR